MTIKGLVPQLAERGKIKCGGLGDKRKKQGKEEFYRLPQKHDYFTITTLSRNEAGDLIPDKELMDRLKKESGNPPKLTEIPVRLLYNAPELNFPTRLAVYKGKRVWCTGDGETAQRFEEGAGSGPGKYGGVACPCERWDPTYDKPDKCKSLGTLSVMIDGVDRVGGVWKFRTTSYNSITNLLSSMALILQVTGGRLAGLPLSLMLSPKTVTVPTTGQSMVVYVASLEYRGTIEALRQEGYHLKKEEIEHQVRMDLLEDQARRHEVSLHEEPEAEQAATGEEFYPETVAAEITDVKPQESKEPESEPELETATTGQDTRKFMTIPQLMEAVQAQACLTFPVPLMTTKGFEIGELVTRTVKDDVQTLVLEMRPDMPEVANGLSVDMIARTFKEAGIETVFQAQGTHQDTEPPEEEGGAVHEELTTAAQAQAGQGKGKAGREVRQSLF